MELIETIWDIFADVFNDFFFELNNGFLNLLIHGMSGGAQSRKYGRHRSLVRLIGTALPLKPCQRTYSSMFLSDNKYGSYSPFESETINYPDEGSNSFDDWSRDLKSHAPDVISSITFSTPKEGQMGKNKMREISAEKFAALEEQVLQLQADIAKILSAQLLQPVQESKTTVEESRNIGLRNETVQENLEDDPVSSTTHVITMPPIPPPPPLPPPQFSLPPRGPIGSQSLTDQINLYSKDHLNNASCKQEQTSTKPPCMGEVLKNIGNVKLRHVERTPGGTPLRRPPLSPARNDPAALLAAALRRRFARMRPDEYSPEQAQLNSSNHRKFSELSPKPFEDMDQLSYTLSPQEINNIGTLKI